MYWDEVKKDSDRWVDQCLTCLRHRRRPTKQESMSVKPVDGECWEEITIAYKGFLFTYKGFLIRYIAF